MEEKKPRVAVDFIIKFDKGIVLVKRKNFPKGWAIPGGMVDYGETIEEAAVREAKEETNLHVEIQDLFGVYSDPKRDPRWHTISPVFLCRGKGELKAGDDAEEAKVFKIDEIPKLEFDHNKIIEDFKEYDKKHENDKKHEKR